MFKWKIFKCCSISKQKGDFNNTLFSLKKKTLSLHFMTMFTLFVPKQ